MQTPLVSVVILSYNHEDYIRTAIEGCLMQKTSFPYEIIIHDDASTDNTTKIIQEYADEYPGKIIPIIQNKNQYSKGLRILPTIFPKIILPKAKGKYIAFCEADDYWIDSHKLERQAVVMQGNSSVSMCFTAVKREKTEKSKNNKVIKRYHRGNFFFSSKDVIIRAGDSADIVSTIVRKEIFYNLPNWYSLSPVGDLALYLLAMNRGRIFYLDEITAVYRLGVNNSWTQRIWKKSNQKAKTLKEFLRLFEEFDTYEGEDYHKYVQRRINIYLVNLLTFYDLESTQASLYQKKLSIRGKFEYNLLKLFKSQWLWEKYLSLIKKFRLY